MRKIRITTTLFVLLCCIGTKATDEKPYNYNIINDSAEIIPTEVSTSLNSLLNDWYLNNTSITNCNKEFSLITYPDSIYIDRLQRLPYVMEMPFNNLVRNFINFYANKPTQVAFMLGIGEQYYFPIFEHALEAQNIPLELKYLPVIESALNPKALSRAGARGLWQFMIGTGRFYGLEINSLVDERCDPVKSTQAAARYLKDLYDIYQDWHLVIAAYNCGPGNVNKAIKRAGGKRNYWEIYPYLPRETRSYVPIFIAANYIMNYYEEHNICPITPSIQTVTDTVMTNQRIHLKQISEVLQIPIEELRSLNPQYKHDLIPANDKKHYAVVLPLKQVNAYIDKKEEILAFQAEQLTSQTAVAKIAEADLSTATVHRVRSGDTLSGIAKKYRVSVAQLKKWNHLNGTTIRIGQKLRICR